MARDPGEFRYRKEEYLTEQVESGRVSAEDGERIREVVDAFDEDRPTVPKPQWPDAPDNITQYREDTTLANWLYYLTKYAMLTELSTATAADLNQIAEDMLTGDAETVDKKDGLTKGSIRAYQNSARIFYRYHDDLDVDPMAIQVFSRSSNGNGNGGSSFEPDEILTREEIDAVRAAAGDYRDAAVFELLLGTGMRNRALRTLRVRDVDPAEGSYRFNAGEDGLKDLYKPRAKRPLLGGARSAVSDWLDHHPTPDDPDTYLITANSKYTEPDPSSAISDRTISRICERLKADSGIQKPMHPHMLRHNFVYICKRVYELPDDTIKFYLGHAPDSSIMESTYSHLSAEDHFERGQVAAGIIDEDGADVGFEFEECPVCDKPLPEGAKACPQCGASLTPDAVSAEEQIDESMKEAYKETEPDDEEVMAELDALDEVLADPEVKALILEKLEEE